MTKDQLITGTGEHFDLDYHRVCNGPRGDHPVPPYVRMIELSGQGLVCKQCLIIEIIDHLLEQPHERYYRRVEEGHVRKVLNLRINERGSFYKTKVQGQVHYSDWTFDETLGELIDNVCIRLAEKAG